MNSLKPKKVKHTRHVVDTFPRKLSVGTMTQKITKEEIYWKVLNAVLNLDFKKGHQKWTISEVSRMSGVGRPLIYYYFGRSKISLLLEAVRLIGEELMGLNENRLKFWESGAIAQSVITSRNILQKTPILGSFYLAHRFKESEIGAALRQLEKEYFKKMKIFFPKASSSELEALFGLFLGLVLAPSISDQAVEQAVQYLRLLDDIKIGAN